MAEWSQIPEYIADAIESMCDLRRDTVMLGDRESLGTAPISDRGFRLDFTSTAPLDSDRGEGRAGVYEHEVMCYLSHDLSGAPDRRTARALLDSQRVSVALGTSSYLRTRGMFYVDVTDIERTREDGRLIQALTVAVRADTTFQLGAE